MGIIFDAAVQWRITRINQIRQQLSATPPHFVTARLKLEEGLAFERAQLAELLVDGRIRPEASRKAM